MIFKGRLEPLLFGLLLIGHLLCYRKQCFNEAGTGKMNRAAEKTFFTKAWSKVDLTL